MLRLKSKRTWSWPHERAWAVGMLSAVALLALVANCVPSLTQFMEFDRGAMAQGELWRLVSGHLTHWNSDQLLWDLATFVGLSVVCLWRSPRAFLWCVAGSALAISVGIWIMQPEIATYRGLSGIDSALFTLLAVGLGREALLQRDGVLLSAAALGLVAFLGKTGYELATGLTFFLDGGAVEFTPLTSAHAVGASVGILIALLAAPISQHQSTSATTRVGLAQTSV